LREIVQLIEIFSGPARSDIVKSRLPYPLKAREKMRDAVRRFEPGAQGRYAASIILRAAWTLIRLPVLALLVILEPVARVVLAGFALLMTLTAFFWVAVLGLSAFPFWRMLALAIGAWLLLAFYYALVRLFSL
jgi:hypothetical protein